MSSAPEIPGYKILEPIGRGGMAVVYLALQESLGRQVALKVMEPALASDRLLCERFLKEGHFIARMSSHQNIVTVYDIGCHGQCYYMAMEYIPAGSLKDRLAHGDRPERPLAVIRDIATALKHAHDGAIIHRDVKPGNILFREDGTAVLTDFGIAKAEDTETQFTQIGTTVGSPAYMSLEQRIGAGVDARSDLYSLGVVLFELLAGYKPFSGQGAGGMGQAQQSGRIPQLPDELYAYQDIINRLLANHPADRYQDAGSLIAAIEDFEAECAAGAVSHPRPARNKHARRHGDAGGGLLLRRAAWGAGLLVPVVLAVLGYRFLNDDASPRVLPTPAPVEYPSAGDSELSPSARAAKIRRLLSVAAAHISVGRLAEPPGSNAADAYRLVLEIDPDNAQARQGLARVERLLAERDGDRPAAP
jgi:serine/threonine-protein kinase PpkA